MTRGRTHPVWNEFVIDNDGAYPDVTCKHCPAKLYKSQPSRNLLGHLASCPNLAAQVESLQRVSAKKKRKLKKRKKASHATSLPATQDSIMSEVSLSQSQSVANFGSEMSAAEKDRFQAEIARGFYAAGLPFRSIEVPRMRKALTILQPGMEKYLPTRKALAGRLLTKEYEHERSELIARLRDEPTLALISDGWSNVSKEKVVNYVVASPLMWPLLWCTKTTGEDEQTAEYVAEAIGDVIDEIHEAVGRAVIVSVTTDNAPVMQRAWAILERGRPLCCNGCSSHTLNLILEEVLHIPWLSWALSRSVTLSKFVRNRPQLLARFRNLQKARDKEAPRRTLRLPVPTRWYSSFECVKSVSDNHGVISRLFRQTKYMKRFGRRPAKLNEAREIVKNRDFLKRLKLVMTLLQPLIEAVALLGQDTCCISMVHWQFSQLQRCPLYQERVTGVPRAVQLNIVASVKAKWDFLHTDTMGASFLLDHTKETSEFVDADFATSVGSISQLAVHLGHISSSAEMEQISNEATEFYLKKGRWSPETRAKQGKLSPMAWWTDKVTKTVTDEDYYPLLAPLAATIYTILTSSAASERSWSIHDFIHTKRRNRLDARRVEKLVFIYSNAGNKDAKANIFYKVADESESESESDADVDDDSAESEDSTGSSGTADDLSNSNAYSYDGSQEQRLSVNFAENLVLLHAFVKNARIDGIHALHEMHKWHGCMHCPIPRKHPSLCCSCVVFHKHDQGCRIKLRKSPGPRRPVGSGA